MTWRKWTFLQYSKPQYQLINKGMEKDKRVNKEKLAEAKKVKKKQVDEKQIVKK